MEHQNVVSKMAKALLIVLFCASVGVNFYQSRIIEKQGLTSEHLFNYKRAYIKIIEVLGVSPEKSEVFLKKVRETKPSP